MRRTLFQLIALMALLGLFRPFEARARDDVDPQVGVTAPTATKDVRRPVIAFRFKAFGYPEALSFSAGLLALRPLALEAGIGLPNQLEASRLSLLRLELPEAAEDQIMPLSWFVRGGFAIRCVPLRPEGDPRLHFVVMAGVRGQSFHQAELRGISAVVGLELELPRLPIGLHWGEHFQLLMGGTWWRQREGSGAGTTPVIMPEVQLIPSFGFAF